MSFEFKITITSCVLDCACTIAHLSMLGKNQNLSEFPFKRINFLPEIHVRISCRSYWNWHWELAWRHSNNLGGVNSNPVMIKLYMLQTVKLFFKKSYVTIFSTNMMMSMYKYHRIIHISSVQWQCFLKGHHPKQERLLNFECKFWKELRSLPFVLLHFLQQWVETFYWAKCPALQTSLG